jgi:hypothetical protein
MLMVCSNQGKYYLAKSIKQVLEKFRGEARTHVDRRLVYFRFLWLIVDVNWLASVSGTAQLYEERPTVILKSAP